MLLALQLAHWWNFTINLSRWRNDLSVCLLGSPTVLHFPFPLQEVIKRTFAFRCPFSERTRIRSAARRSLHSLYSTSTQSEKRTKKSSLNKNRQKVWSTFLSFPHFSPAWKLGIRPTFRFQEQESSHSITQPPGRLLRWNCLVYEYTGWHWWSRT